MNENFRHCKKGISYEYYVQDRTEYKGNIKTKTIQHRYTNNNIVSSTTLLFERPVQAKSEGNTFDLTRTDGVIHLPKNKLNHVLSTFSMEMSKGQIFKHVWWNGEAEVDM